MMERLAERRMQKDVSLDQNTNYFQEEEEGDEDGYEDDEDEVYSPISVLLIESQ